MLALLLSSVIDIIGCEPTELRYISISEWSSNSASIFSTVAKVSSNTVPCSFSTSIVIAPSSLSGIKLIPWFTIPNIPITISKTVMTNTRRRCLSVHWVALDRALI